ncbi:MAG: bifunctional diaminohydroxyphosphoribosylaminopyrimidine deaminase/5-amino-6-(5-phosphoribosylamino)uracil reductase RibD [Actinomycetota bacterium]|nr:bifunctional diaminohydroxyphosphoribosylaminopyrimidine deaminase/5-amino-6-(5-phosphoribosylamino)uracil reductase RibD [Actinomycetota bacterium]
MARAIDLARLGLGRTSPNPIVGAVILDADGAVAGEGFHAGPGGPHAEVEALWRAGERARRGTAVVTLEPCAHTGRTPPCTEALLTAGVTRVVYAVADPNPVAAGGGEALRAAGVHVRAGLLAAEAGRANEAWLHAVRTGRPFVIWKYAAGLDGRVAAVDGSSRWITGEAARADVHRLRAECDAVLVGSGTVLADDPQLTVRTPDGPASRQPLRVVLDSAGRTPAGARVRDGAAPTVILTAADVPAGDGGLDLSAVLRLLHDRGVRSVLLEGGPTLAGSFLQEDLIDRVEGYVAPLLIGGGGLPALAGGGAATIADACRLRLDAVERFGDDVRLTARPVRATSAIRHGG